MVQVRATQGVESARCITKRPPTNLVTIRTVEIGGDSLRHPVQFADLATQSRMSLGYIEHFNARYAINAQMPISDCPNSSARCP